MTSPALSPAARVLLITEDDDVGETIAVLLRRPGYSVEIADGREGAERLASEARAAQTTGAAASGEAGAAQATGTAQPARAALPAGGLPDALILDGDLAPETRGRILEILAPHGGPTSFPLLVLGGGPSPPVPAGWHEDAFALISRPLQPGEILATLAALRRLAFYRRYRDLIHDLAQPVMTLHALSRSVAKIDTPDPAARAAIDRLVKEAERLMTLMEDFQRRRGAG